MNVPEQVAKLCHALPPGKQVEVKTMTIKAIVNEDGTLIAKVPARFKGKKVRVSVQETNTEAPPQWDEIARIVHETGKMDISRRTHEEILRDLRKFRESG